MLLHCSIYFMTITQNRKKKHPKTKTTRRQKINVRVVCMKTPNNHYVRHKAVSTENFMIYALAKSLCPGSLVSIHTFEHDLTAHLFKYVWQAYTQSPPDDRICYVFSLYSQYFVHSLVTSVFFFLSHVFTDAVFSRFV